MALHLKNMELPSVPLMLDIERRFRMDLNAMRRFQEATGKDILEVFPQPARDADGNVLPPERQPPIKLDMDALCSAVWACLVWEDPTLTADEAGILMTLAPLETITKAMLDSFYVAMPHLRQDGRKEASDPLEQKRTTIPLAQAPPGGGSPS